MKQLLTLLVLCATLFTAKAQLSGRIIDSKTKQPIAFVNIGLLGKSIGTVSDENGFFMLKTTDANSNDTLMISVLGYKKLSYTIKNYENIFSKDNATVLLQEESFNLNEVTVVPKVIINKTLGNTTNTKSISAGFSSNDLGSEVGVPMNVKKNRRCFIDTLFFNINNCKFDSVLFRVNIYTMKNGKPDSSILIKPLYVLSKVKFGTLKVDVTHLKLETNTDFFVALEWLKDLGKGGLNFPAGFTNSHSYFRNASQGNWEKAPVGLGFYCKTRQEK